MTSSNEPNHMGDTHLVRRTLRTMGLFVAACVLFVGMLSVVAVAIASRAVSAAGRAEQAADTPPLAPTQMRGVPPAPTEARAKKPLAI